MLGQNQECYGACFSPSQSLDGSMAAVRVWDRVLSQASHPAASPVMHTHERQMSVMSVQMKPASRLSFNPAQICINPHHWGTLLVQSAA